MVVLMGGKYSQGYQLFQSLTVKAFLAIRPFADQIVDTVHLMLDTGFPSFKGEPTIRRLRDRFVLYMTERQAADYMMSVIRDARENLRSTAYDEFQRVRDLHFSSIHALTACIASKRHSIQRLIFRLYYTRYNSNLHMSF